MRCHSSRLDDGVEQILNCNVIPKDLTSDAVHFALLLANLLFKLCLLVLKGLNNIFSNLLLFFEGLSAGDRLFAPMLELLAHAVHVVSDKVNRLA